MKERRIRPIRIEGDTAFVPLTQGYEAIIDAADVPLVEGYNWHAMVRRRPDGSIRTVYAVRRGRVRMHRTIAATPAGMDTDHRDGDGLNNRRGNLRAATAAQNAHNQQISVDNTSGFKGVAWHKVSGKWLAQIGVFGGRRYLGLFSSVEAAAAAYAKASAELHGEFGRTDSIFFARDSENTQCVPHG